MYQYTAEMLSKALKSSFEVRRLTRRRVEPLKPKQVQIVCKKVQPCKTGLFQASSNNVSAASWTGALSSGSIRSRHGSDKLEDRRGGIFLDEWYDFSILIAGRTRRLSRHVCSSRVVFHFFSLFARMFQDAGST